MRKLVGVITVATLALIARADAAPFRFEPHPLPSLIINARVDCRTYRQGNKTITEYCKDGYVCGRDKKCLPGPEMQRKLDDEKKKLEEAIKSNADQIAELEAMADQLNQRARDQRRELRRLDGGCMSDPNYCRPAPTPIARTQPAAQAQPHAPGGSVSGHSASAAVTTYRETVFQDTYQPGTWYYWTSDWKTIPTPRYSGEGRTIREPSPPRPGRRMDPTKPFDCSYKPAGAGAAWDAECQSDGSRSSNSESEKRYRPRLDPQALYAQARLTCLTVNGEDYANCIRDAKLKILLSDPDVAKQCGQLASTEQFRCVDRVYLYGPRGMSPLKQFNTINRAKLQIRELVQRRDQQPAGSVTWRVANDELRRLDETLRADEFDLSEIFKNSGVYRNAGSAPPPPSGSGSKEQKTEPPVGEPDRDPNGHNSVAGQQPAVPDAVAADRKPLSEKDEIYCLFVARRISLGDAAYPTVQSVPEACRDSQDIASAFAVRQNGPPIFMDSADREWIKDRIAEIEQYGPPTPSAGAP